MNLLGKLRQRVTDANAKARTDMAKVREDYHTSADEHRAELARIKAGKDQARTEGQ